MDISNQELKCKIHPQNKVEFIQIKDFCNQQDNGFFYCTQCIDSDASFKPSDYVLIENVINNGSNSIILKWPPLNDQQIIAQLYRITTRFSQELPIEQQIINYFTKLKEDILKKIDLCQKKMINRAEELPFNNNQIIKKYQEVSKILELRSLLNDYQQPTNAQEEVYKEFLSQMQMQKERNTQELQTLLNHQLLFQELINFEQPNQMKESLLSLIDQINFFNEELINNNKDDKSISNKQQSNDKQNVSEKLMQLISNKSNFCSNQFLTQLQELLQKENHIFKSVSFDDIHENNRLPINFNDINEEEFKMIESHLNHLGKMKNDEEYQNEVKNSIEIKQLNRILSNKLNSIGNIFQEQFEKFMITSYPYLREVNYTDIITNKDHFECFENVSDDDIQDIFQFAYKIKDRNQIKDQNKDLIAKLKPTYQYHFPCLNQRDIDTILTKYPIFDLFQQPKSLDILQKIELIKGDYDNGQLHLSINRKQNNCIEVLTQEIGWKNCVSSIQLDKNLKYIFRFEAQSIDKKGDKHFKVGLMQSHNFDYEGGYEDQLFFNFKIHYNQVICNGGHINNQIKGDGFRIQQDNFVELRVCINEQILEILDFPHYNYRYCVSDQKKQNLINHKDLRLYIGVQSLNSKIILKNVLEVESFEV